MKTIPIYIRVINPEGKKVSVMRRIDERSQAPIGDAFFNYTEGKENRHQYQLAGEGAW